MIIIYNEEPDMMEDKKEGCTPLCKSFLASAVVSFAILSFGMATFSKKNNFHFINIDLS